MGICHGKQTDDKNPAQIKHLPDHCSPPRSSPFHGFKRPPSPAKHINAFLARRNAPLKTLRAPNGISSTTPHRIPAELDKNFGYSKNFYTKYEMGDEIGRGYFGYITRSKVKKGESKGQDVAVKVMAKAKMNTTIGIEDIRREVRILSTITEHENLVRFLEAFEDEDNVYIVMELCTGGELLEKILSRGGKYMEEEAKMIVVQILSAISYCHLQGIVHRDLKPENFLFSSKEDDSLLKLIDFGLSDFIKPEERLNDIVGSSYYVAPEVLHRSYGTEADMWSIGVISYILLCGIRPFWDRRESGIFRAVLKAEPCFHDQPWPSLSSDARDFVKNLLVKDCRRRMTAVQALCHPWISRNHEVPVTFDILVFKRVKAYIISSELRKSALRALAKTMTLSELCYLQRQFTLLGPNKNGYISIQNLKMVLESCIWSDAMRESKVSDFIESLSNLEYRKMSFDEFVAAAISVHQLEGSENWERCSRRAYEQFDKNDNKPITIDELTSELGLGVSISIHSVLLDWIRYPDGKLSFLGFVKLLYGPSSD